MERDGAATLRWKGCAESCSGGFPPAGCTGAFLVTLATREGAAAAAAAAAAHAART